MKPVWGEKEYKPIPFIRDLMEGKSVEEMEEAEENFRKYLSLLMRVADRLVKEETAENPEKREVDPKSEFEVSSGPPKENLELPTR